MLIVATASFAAFGGIDSIIEHTVVVSPNKAKNKAFRMEAGSAVCDLYLTPESPWAIRDSRITGRDDKTLWKKIDKAHYFMVYGYAVNEYVKIDGDLYKSGTGTGGAGTPEYPPFSVTVPKVDLQWGEKHGDASKEEKEDDTPVVLVVSESKNLFGRLLVHPPKDDLSIETRKCRVTLLWSPADAVKVFKDGTEIGTKTAFDFDSSDAKPIELDVCAVKSAVDVKFTLEGEPDNVNKDRAVDYVHAKCVALDFTVKSDKKYDYDAPTTEELIDNRTATITVETTPKGVDVTDLGIKFEARAAEKGELVNCFNKFDVVIAHKAGNQWKTKDVVYWYGVKQDRLGYNERFKYVFDLKYKGEVLKSKQLSVRWPEGNSHGGWIPTVSNGTVPGEIKHHTTTTPSYWYCKIDFKKFDKYPGFTWTDDFTDFHDTSQYSAKIKDEEEYHVKQLRGEVDIEHGGQADCYTVKGLQYFVGELAKDDMYKKYITRFYEKNGEKEGCWGVKGDSEKDVLDIANEVIKAAVEKEIAESKRVMKYNADKDVGKRGYMELKAKEVVDYNAAWLYRYTYLSVFGPNPKRMIHKAYQKPNPESYEVR